MGKNFVSSMVINCLVFTFSLKVPLMPIIIFLSCLWSLPIMVLVQNSLTDVQEENKNAACYIHCTYQVLCVSSNVIPSIFTNASVNECHVNNLNVNITMTLTRLRRVSKLSNSVCTLLTSWSWYRESKDLFWLLGFNFNVYSGVPLFCRQRLI